MDVSRIIPLGSRCRLTHNLRAHFGFTTGYPFDWYILPLHGLLAILEEGLEAGAVYHPDLLVEERDEAGRVQHIRNARYGIIHEHDFPKDATQGVLPGWREHIPRAAARFAALARRLAERPPGPPPLFVRERHGADRAPELLRLPALLEKLQPGGFELLLVNYRPGQLPEGMASLTIEERPGFGWRGDGEAWSAALAGRGYRLAASCGGGM
ncbi:papain-like cysteine peptidase [Roseomonas sp. GC11]|uniref:papain-like cysteine peptidase n=1 Tax=Roseomonas sp. GC11 TaxID=2950546 RepID=UPI00210C634B|nr:papain-like cysteine peptidase [Roseomonas sp. GC11]MCQ4159822.1 papain-like cysteine peptidase [Roseomonas sp. GC11]